MDKRELLKKLEELKSDFLSKVQACDDVLQLDAVVGGSRREGIIIGKRQEANSAAAALEDLIRNASSDG